MTFLFAATPGDNDPEDGSRGSQYISRKDLKWLIVAAIVLVIIGWPVYRYKKGQADWHTCGSNLNAIYQAMSLYAADHDDRFPPIAREADPNTGTPIVENGKVDTWVTEAFAYDPRVSIFQCPAAPSEDTTATDGSIPPKSAKDTFHFVTVPSSYGMYAGYSAAAKSMIERSSQTVFISETANYGSSSSYDPMPFKDLHGKVVPFDGFSIGWDTGNKTPGENTKRITRLAFPGSANGDFSKAASRHDEGIHAITPDGNTIILHPSDVNVNMRGGSPTGIWQVPASIGQ